MFATDCYLDANDWDTTACLPMLLNRSPTSIKPFATIRTGWWCSTDSRWLRFPDDRFDGIFSSGSLERLSDLRQVAQSAFEMGRVLKPGGVLSVTTVVRLDGPDDTLGAVGGSLVFSREQLQRYVIDASGLEPVDELRTEISPATRATCQSLECLMQGQLSLLRSRRSDHLESNTADYFPALVIDHSPAVFGSVHLALRKTACPRRGTNQWPGRRRGFANGSSLPGKIKRWRR